MYVNYVDLKIFFSWCPLSFLALTPFLPSRLQGSLYPKGKVLIKTSGAEWPKVDHSFCLIVDLCTCFCLLQEEGSLLMTEQGTNLWIEQNIIKSHFTRLLLLLLFCLFWFLNSSIWFCQVPSAEVMGMYYNVLLSTWYLVI